MGLYCSLAQMEQWDQAYQCLQKVKLLNPYEEAIYCNEILFHYANQDLDKAVESFNEAQKKDLYSEVLFRNIALVYAAMGKKEPAINYYKKALELDIHYEDARHELAELYAEHRECKKSIALYREYLAVSKNNCNSFVQLIKYQVECRNFKKAEETALELQKIFPNSPIGYSKLAQIYFNKKDYQKTIVTCFKALQIQESFSGVHHLLALTYWKLGKIKLAERYFNTAQQTSELPDIGMLRDYYSFLHFQKRYDEMSVVINRVMKLEKHDIVDEQLFLAGFYRRQNQKQKAELLLTEGLKRYPNDPDLSEAFGAYLIEDQRYEEAIALLKSALKTFRYDKALLRLLYKAFMHSKSYKPALDHLNSLISSCPTPKLQKWIEQKLIALSKRIREDS
jgi:tetratricopeptide (TPR) repeat protein